MPYRPAGSRAVSPLRQNHPAAAWHCHHKRYQLAAPRTGTGRLELEPPLVCQEQSRLAPSCPCRGLRPRLASTTVTPNSSSSSSSSSSSCSCSRKHSLCLSRSSSSSSRSRRKMGLEDERTHTTLHRHRHRIQPRMLWCGLVACAPSRHSRSGRSRRFSSRRCRRRRRPERVFEQSRRFVAGSCFSPRVCTRRHSQTHRALAVRARGRPKAPTLVRSATLATTGSQFHQTAQPR